MAKKAAEKTAGISMAGFQPRTRVFDGQTPPGTPEAVSPPPSPARPAGKPFTGVGNVMAAITREVEVGKELSAVRAELAGARQDLERYKSADLVERLDPRAIRASRWANRNVAEFSTAEFAQLKDEISGAGGNVQPIKVRRIPGAAQVFDGQTPVFEIVFGHRRHRACLELGIPVLAAVAEQMEDQALFEAMDRENRSRKNLSAWEQGRMYDEAIRQGLYPSLRRLCERLGVNLSDASRAVQLAKLPAEVVAAFGSPLDLQVRWAKVLGDALQRDPEGVLARARGLSRRRGQLKPAEVLATLLATPTPQPETARTVALGPQHQVTLRTDRAGRLTLEFEPGAIGPQQEPALLALLTRFLQERPASGG